MTQAFPWLPETALFDGVLAQHLRAQLDSWAEEWCRLPKTDVRATSSSTVTDGASLAIVGAGSCVELRLGEAAQLALGQHLLGGTASALLEAVDGDIARSLVTRALGDLHSRLMSSCRDGAAGQRRITGQPMFYSCALGHSSAEAELRLDRSWACRVRGDLVPANPPSKRPVSATKIQLATSTTASVQLLLGEAALSLSELQDLRKGDILLLDGQPSERGQLGVRNEAFEMICAVSYSQGTSGVELKIEHRE